MCTLATDPSLTSRKDECAGGVIGIKRTDCQHPLPSPLYGDFRAQCLLVTFEPSLRVANSARPRAVGKGPVPQT